MYQIDYEDKLRQSSQKLASRINFPENLDRREQLAEKLFILFRNGFDENLFHEMDTKFFVEKGFSISEALLIQKKQDDFHPTIDEIQRLKKDDVTNILKLEYIKPNLENNLNYYYILVIGPIKRGKTTVIFNLINTIYNIKRDSLYRVKKDLNEQNKYYDEYFIQINEKDCYVFVEFKGIGDIQQDFLGLDGRSNLFTTILQYIQNKQILSILYVNSSSINKLGYEEQYQLQRFFEILPKSYLNKILLILTYCTDNQPLLNIYSSPLNTSVPQEMKEIMNVAKSELVPLEQKFWFGINNAFLYEKFDYRLQKKFLLNKKIDVQAVIDGQQFLEIHIEEDKGEELCQDIYKFNPLEESSEIQIPSSEYESFCFVQMLYISKQILHKIFLLKQDIAQQETDRRTFQQQFLFEQAIAKTLDMQKQLSDREFPNFIIKSGEKSNYINYKYQESLWKLETASKCLYCFSCNSVCHKICTLKNFSQIYSNQKFCLKLIDNRTKPYQENAIQQYQIQCKSCLKQQNNCSLITHQLIEIIHKETALIGEIQVEDQNKFYQTHFFNKKEKSISRLEQTTYFKMKLTFMCLVNKIQEEKQNIISKEDRLVKINLVKRVSYINTMLQNKMELDNSVLSNFLNLQNIYNQLESPLRHFDLDAKIELLSYCELEDENQARLFDFQKQNELNSFAGSSEIQYEFEDQINIKDLNNYIIQSKMRVFYEQYKKQKQNIDQQNLNQVTVNQDIDNIQSLKQLGKEQQTLNLNQQGQKQHQSDPSQQISNKKQNLLQEFHEEKTDKIIHQAQMQQHLIVSRKDLF